jgi:hypothetical protein
MKSAHSHGRGSASSVCQHSTATPVVLNLPRMKGFGSRAGAQDCNLAVGDQMVGTNVVSDRSAPVRRLTASESEHVLGAAAHDYQARWSQNSSEHHILTNLFTDEAIRFEPSPSNIVLRPAVRSFSDRSNRAIEVHANAYELGQHDLDGSEAITNPVPRLRRSSRCPGVQTFQFAVRSFHHARCA